MKIPSLLLLLSIIGCGNQVSVTKHDVDNDNDSYNADIDCDDADANINPAADEICDGIDNNCDEIIDTDAVDAPSWYVDGDEDGYGAGEATVTCENPDGTMVEADGDCDDTVAAVSPAAQEVCNGIDDNCDTLTDGADASGATDWYADEDHDSFGDPNVKTSSCNAPLYTVTDATDCNDQDAAVSPVGIESCNGIDDDCDGNTDEADAIDPSTWFADTDGDGYGDPAVTIIQCDLPLGYSASSDDCDDTNGSTYPGALEHCDNTDSDCDGQVAENDSVDAPTWYADTDGDGHGNIASTIVTCSLPSGYIDNTDDCDDGDGSVYPGAPEYCDGVDHDCDGLINEDGSVDALHAYTDADGDGFGDPATETLPCTQPANQILIGDDCDDTESAINPNAKEICDGIDNSCLGGPDWNLNVPAVYATIQDSVNAAAEGDTICIAAGTYVESVVVYEKSLTLNGYEGLDVTTIDGGGAGRSLEVTNATTFTMSNLTLVNGNNGVYLHNIGDSDVQDVVVSDNVGTSTGAGLIVQGGGATLSNVVISGNVGTNTEIGGAGLYVDGALLDAENLWIVDNTLNFSNICYGAGIYIRQDATVSITDAVIANNACTTTTAAAYVAGAAGMQDNSTVTLQNVTIANNTATTLASSPYSAGWYYTSDDGDPLVAINVTSTGNTFPSSRTPVTGGWLMGGLQPSGSFSYCNTYGNDGDTEYWGITDPTETNGNISEDPMFTDTSAALALDWDLTPASGSPLIDAGDPSLFDADGSRSDIGALDGI